MTDVKFEIEEIYRLAECLARTGGYSHFRINRVADQAGLPSSSVYRHIGSKTQLAVAIVRRFGESVFEKVGAASDPATSAKEKLATFIDVYRQSITDDGQLCLFLVFGTELSILPEAVRAEVKQFFAIVFDWLAELLRRFPEYAPSSGRDARQGALAIVAALNGAQICTRVTGDRSIFNVIVEQNYASGIIPGRTRRP